MTVDSLPPGDLARHLAFVTTPALWPAWPFLPVIRSTPAAIELGLMFDARTACGLTGYSAAVFRCCLFNLPPTVSAFLAAAEGRLRQRRGTARARVARRLRSRRRRCLP